MRKASMFMLAGLAVVVAGCGSSSSSSSSSTPAAAATSSSSSSAAPTSSSTSAAAAPATSGGGASVHLSAVAGKLAFNTTKLSAKAGTVTLALANPSTFPHGIAIEGKGVDKDGKVVGNGGTSTVTVKLKPGTYTYYCPVPGHRAAGMQGTLTVT
jgi:plastocyanin